MTAARGYSSASAREAALKLVETSYVSAHGMSSADLLHGPVALLDQSVPLLCFTSAGPGRAGDRTSWSTLAGQRGVDVDVIGDGTVAGRTLPAVLPRGVAPELRPVLEILPAQLLAADVAVGPRLRPGRAPRPEQGDAHLLSGGRCGHLVHAGEAVAPGEQSLDDGGQRVRGL